ncbi:MAG: hypothetical protein H0V70_22010 [Ktedonobacteraceae bacterium]|nr:hypothetical protein [Ktedonobacteraceae bacterium]
MRRTIYVLLCGLFLGICFSCLTQHAFAAPRIINGYTTASSPEKQVYNQYENTKYAALTELQLNKHVYSSTDRVGKSFQSNFLWNTHASEAASQHSFGFPWPSIKALDISSLWKQQHDKQKKKDVYDYGE